MEPSGTLPRLGYPSRRKRRSHDPPEAYKNPPTSAGRSSQNNKDPPVAPTLHQNNMQPHGNDWKYHNPTDIGDHPSSNNITIGETNGLEMVQVTNRMENSGRIPAIYQEQHGYLLITSYHLRFKGTNDITVGKWSWGQLEGVVATNTGAAFSLWISTTSCNGLAFQFNQLDDMMEAQSTIQRCIDPTKPGKQPANEGQEIPPPAETFTETPNQPVHIIKTVSYNKAKGGSDQGTSTDITPTAIVSNSTEQELSQLRHDLRLSLEQTSQLQKELREQKEAFQELEMRVEEKVTSMVKYRSSHSKGKAVDHYTSGGATTAFGDLDPALKDRGQWQDEFEGLLDGNMQPMSEEDLHVPFGESVYTLLFMYGFRTQGFWFGLFVCALQGVSISLTLIGAINFDAQENKLQIPPMVDATVTAVQATALFVLLPYNTDLIDAVVKLQDGSYHEEVQQGYRYHNENGYHVQSAHPSASYLSWLFSCLSQLFVGILLIVGSFILTIKAETAVDVMLNLTALLFLTEMDDLGFLMAKKGFLTNELQEDTETVKEYKLPKRESKSGHIFRRALYFLVLLALFIGYGFFKQQQLSGSFLPTYVNVQFGDAYNYKIGFYSGLYKAHTGRNPTYRTYHDIVTGNMTVLAYCEAKKVWTFSDKGDPCDYFAKSPETTNFDVTSIPSSEWVVLDQSTNRFRPFDSFGLVNQDCKPEICQGNCSQGLCHCPHDRFGINCEFGADSVCETLVTSDDTDPFPDWKIENRFQNKVNEIAISDTYHMLRNATGAAVKFQTMPVYYSIKTYPANIIFFGGFRWILTHEYEQPNFTEEITNRISGKFHPIWKIETQYTPYFFSDSMDFQTPDFQATPIDVRWWTLKSWTVSRYDTRHQMNTTERAFQISSQLTTQLTCKEANCTKSDVNIFCGGGDRGFCNQDSGTCICASGWYGSRCTHKGECNQCNQDEVCDALSGKCRCKTPHHGSRCKETYLCWEEGGKCRNGGLCGRIDGYCTCPPDDPTVGGWRCEKRATCSAYGCQNGGICAPNGRCICYPPYYGTLCSLVDKSQKQLLCSRDEDCVNGSCDSEIDGICICDDPAAFGTLCQFQYNCAAIEQTNTYTNNIALFFQGDMESNGDDDSVLDEDETFVKSCLNSGSCNYDSGLCSCPEGYFGPDCSKYACDDTGDEDCDDGGGGDEYSYIPMCDKHGQCAHRTTRFSPMPDGCNKDTDCYNRGICDMKKNKCTCTPRFSGGKCDYITVGDYPPFWDDVENAMRSLGCHRNPGLCMFSLGDSLGIVNDDDF